MKTLGGAFLFGSFAAISQVLLAREVMIACGGNELTVALFWSLWFVAIGAGSIVAMALVERFQVHHLRRLTAVTVLVDVLVLPVLVVTARSARSWIGVDAGGNPDLGQLLYCAGVTAVPAGLLNGLLFPLITRLVAQSVKAPIAATVAGESAGFAAGGLLYTLLIGMGMDVTRAVGVASLAGLVCAFILSPQGAFRSLVVLCLLGVLAVMLLPPLTRLVETKGLAFRWRGTTSTVLLDVESPYHNLALLDNNSQATLYTDGYVESSFPDQHLYEHQVHFIMAQRPSAPRVLVVGGNPLGILPEVLRYQSVNKVVFVEQDQGREVIWRRLDAKLWQALRADARVSLVREDPVLFLRRHPAAFDCILLTTPEPSTLGANRFYTREFFKVLRSSLRERGFAWMSLDASDRMERQISERAASVFFTMRGVFPVVVPALGSRLHLFMSDRDGFITSDRQELFRRSRLAALDTTLFRPEYFLKADEFDPDKMALLDSRLNTSPVPVNTLLKPSTVFYDTALWARMGGDAWCAVLLDRLKKWSPYTVLSRELAKIMTSLGILIAACGVLGFVTGLSRRAGALTTTGIMTLVTLFSGMAAISIELVLIFLFQSLFGSLYSKLALFAALFMVGLVAGAFILRFAAPLALVRQLQLLLGISMALLALVFSLPFVIAASEIDSQPMEALLMGMNCITGMLCGMSFVTAARTAQLCAMRTGTVAALLNLGDHVGAAAGALVTGVICIPLWGMTGTILFLGFCQMLALLLVITAMVASRRI